MIPAERPHALLLDLDGTLIDSRRDIADAVQRTLVAHGKRELRFEEILPLIGDGARTLVARAFFGADVASAADDAELDRGLSSFTAFYAERPVAQTTLLPGARALLQIGIPSALVTNKPRGITMLVLEGLGLTSALPFVWAGGDGRMKPAPDGIRSVLAQLDVAPSRAWMIGDGPQDVLAGKAAGCFTIAVPGIAERAIVEAAEPDLVVSSLEEIVGLLRARPSAPAL